MDTYCECRLLNRNYVLFYFTNVSCFTCTYYSSYKGNAISLYGLISLIFSWCEIINRTEAQLTIRKKGPRRSQGLNPEPSCCDVTVQSLTATKSQILTYNYSTVSSETYMHVYTIFSWDIGAAGDLKKSLWEQTGAGGSYRYR